MRRERRRQIVEERKYQATCSPSPEGGAVWAAARKLLADGWLKPHERIVLFNTGAGVKYNPLFPLEELPRLDHRDPQCLDRVAVEQDQK